MILFALVLACLGAGLLGWSQGTAHSDRKWRNLLDTSASLTGRDGNYVAVNKRATRKW